MKELNRDILINALENLPEYTPSKEVWGAIHADLTEEFNRDTLTEAINTLPEHQPEEANWLQIEHTLRTPKIRNQKLPLKEYEPPANLWDKIEAELPEEKKKGRVITLPKRWLSVAAAAAVLLIAMIALWPAGETQQLVFSEEIIDANETGAWLEEDDDAFAMVLSICEDAPPECEEPEFRALQSELEFLNEAKDAIIINMSDFDENQELVAELTEIELERSEVLKKMIDRLM